MVFQFFKSIVEDDHKLSIKYVLSLSSNREGRPIFAQKHCTSQHSKLCSGSVTNFFSEEREWSNLCSWELFLPFPSRAGPATAATMQTEIVALKNGREAWRKETEHME